MLQAVHDAAVVRQLEVIEEQLASTWKNRDCAGWGDLLADDWSVTHIDGKVVTKQQAIEMCRTGPPVTSILDQLAVISTCDCSSPQSRLRLIRLAQAVQLSRPLERAIQPGHPYLQLFRNNLD